MSIIQEIQKKLERAKRDCHGTRLSHAEVAHLLPLIEFPENDEPRENPTRSPNHPRGAARR